MSCVFCQIAAGEIEPGGAYKALRVIGSSVVFEPVAPVTPGHVLVVPIVHVPDAATDPNATAAVYQAAARLARERGGPFNLITSSGEAATQSVPHLHVHLIPRAVDDGLMVPWGTLYGEDPKAPHRCRQLREIGLLWDQDDGESTQYLNSDLIEALDRTAEAGR